MLKFYHAPMSRSGSILWLLEELQVPYQMEIVDIRREGGAPESYRAVQPNKKVPAIDHDGVVVTERAAIATYLADAFPQAGLAPPIGDPRRGPYLAWLVYVDAVMDPVMAARGHGWVYQNISVSFGAFEDMARHLDEALAAHPYAVGETFTAADTQLGSAVHWACEAVAVLEKTPPLAAYLERISERPGFQRFLAKANVGMDEG